MNGKLLEFENFDLSEIGAELDACRKFICYVFSRALKEPTKKIVCRYL
jgi:hypothetical protein